MKRNTRKKILLFLLPMLMAVLASVFVVFADTIVEYSENEIMLSELLGASEGEVTLTLQATQLDKTIKTKQFTFASGSSITEADINNIDGENWTRYKWKNNENTVVNPITNVFTEDTVLTASATTTGSTATGYVYIDGAWETLDTLSPLYGPYYSDGGDRHLVIYSQLKTLFEDYGFVETAAGKDSIIPIIGYKPSGKTTYWIDTTEVKYFGERAIPLSNATFDYDLFYLPNNTAGANGGNLNNVAADNAFYSISIEADDISAEDIVITGCYNANGKTLALTGTDVTITVPLLEGKQWYFLSDGTDTASLVENGDDTATYTIYGISAPCRLTMEELTVNSNITLRYWASVNGKSDWTQIYSDQQSYGPYSENKYYVMAEHLADVYSKFGLNADNIYPGSAKKRIGWTTGGSSSYINANTIKKFLNKNALELTQNIGDIFDIFYMPVNTYTSIYKYSALTENNHWEVKVEDLNNSTGLGDGTVLAYILNGTTGTVEVPVVEDIIWHCVAEDGTEISPISETDEVLRYQLSNVTQSYRMKAETEKERYTITLHANDATAEYQVVSGTKLLSWLKSIGKENVGGNDVQSYQWKKGTDRLDIGSNDTVTANLDLYGTTKATFTVTFVNKEYGTDGKEGTFANAVLHSYSVYQGDTLSAMEIKRQTQDLLPPEGAAFKRWCMVGQSGSQALMDFTASTVITGDMFVYPDFVEDCTITVYSDASLSTVLGTLEQVALGSSFGDLVLPEFTPPEGRVFEYWVDATGDVHKMISANDKIYGDLILYPSTRRPIYNFMDKDGQSILAVYGNDAVDYKVSDIPEGYYYAGMEVKTDKGTVLIPVNTIAAQEVLEDLGVPVIADEANGNYVIENCNPLFERYHVLRYHTTEGIDYILMDGDNDNLYSEAVEQQFTMLGGMDITRVDGMAGVVLKGWTTDPDTEFDGDIQWEPYEEITDISVLPWTEEDGEPVLDLYPVWGQATDTVKITFSTNYPSGAGEELVDAEGNKLENETYTVYIQRGSRPLMPLLSQVGFVTPANAYTDTDSGTVITRYVVSGWQKQGSAADGSGTANGVYEPGTHYQHAIEEDTTFILRWIDMKSAGAAANVEFFIRDDMQLPYEPGSFETSNYYPSSGATSSYGMYYNTASLVLKELVNIVNDTEKVQANLLTEPSQQTIYNMLKAYGSTSYTWSKIKNLSFDEWEVEWYACKKESTWHLDGRVRIKTWVRLDYNGNGGYNVPYGSVHEPHTTTEVLFANSKNEKPQRDNYTFIGWATDPDAVEPDYPDPSYQANGLDSVYLPVDKTLYAVWKPNYVAIPASGPFRGQKRMSVNNQNAQVLTGAAGEYFFTITLTDRPPGTSSWTRTASLKSDGTFEFPQYQVTKEGVYRFTVCENVDESNLTVQYDVSTYELSILVELTDYGLQIKSYTFHKDGQIVEVVGAGENLNYLNPEFVFTNHIGLRNLSVEKVWDDRDNQDGLRPRTVELQLYQSKDNGYSWSPYPSGGLIVLRERDNWEYEWKGLPMTDTYTGNAILYEVREDEVPVEYTAMVTGDMNRGFTVTNSYEPKLVELSLVKVWNDNSDRTGKRPESIRFNLTGTLPDQSVVYEKEIIVNAPRGTATNTWISTIPDVPVYAEGTMVNYTLTEQTVDGYSGDVEISPKDGDGSWTYTVTNTLKNTEVTITKRVTGNMGDKEKEYSFTARLLDKNGNLITDLPDLSADISFTVQNGIISFKLIHGQSITLNNLPINAVLEISETDHEGYEVSWECGEISETGEQFRAAIEEGMQVTCINDKEVLLDEGIHMDHLPYLLLLGFAVFGLLIFFMRGRRYEG